MNPLSITILINPLHFANFCESTTTALHRLPSYPFLETFDYALAIFAVSSLLITMLAAKTVKPGAAPFALAPGTTRSALAKTFVANTTVSTRLKYTQAFTGLVVLFIKAPQCVCGFKREYPTLWWVGGFVPSVAVTACLESAAEQTGIALATPVTPVFDWLVRCFGSGKSSFVDDYNFINALTEQDSVASLKYGVLFLLALSSLGVYSIILAGWSSNSKYAFMGALRSAAQMISYEVAISLIILPVVTFCGSLDLTMITYVQQITSWLCWPLLPIALLFLIAMLAETNRTPFDLPEAEAELVAGYNVDYSSLPFAMFFLGEYCNMLLISTLFCLLFLSGGLNSIGVASAIVLSLKASVAWIFFVLVRATLPRYRYDQLMDIGWKVFLPTSGSFLLFAFGVLVFFIALPVANELPLFSQ